MKDGITGSLKEQHHPRLNETNVKIDQDILLILMKLLFSAAICLYMEALTNI